MSRSLFFAKEKLLFFLGNLYLSFPLLFSFFFLSFFHSIRAYSFFISQTELVGAAAAREQGALPGGQLSKGALCPHPAQPHRGPRRWRLGHSRKLSAQARQVCCSVKNKKKKKKEEERRNKKKKEEDRRKKKKRRREEERRIIRRRLRNKKKRRRRKKEERRRKKRKKKKQAEQRKK